MRFVIVVATVAVLAGCSSPLGGTKTAAAGHNARPAPTDAVPWVDTPPTVPDAPAAAGPDQLIVSVPRYRNVSAELTVAADVHRGAWLDYTVTLTNNAARAVDFDPCPAYRESLASHSESYQLNCAPRSLAAGRSLRFAMRIAVPSDLPLGATTMTWTLVGSSGRPGTAESAVAATIITIVADPASLA